MAMKTYRIIYERDPSGTWLVRAPRVRGCHTYGRTLAEARQNMREALALFVAGAREARFAEQIRIAPSLKRGIARARRARERAERQRGAAQRALATTARDLTRGAHLSLRDAGELLGLSRQRVQQLLRRRSA
jgi:predicted RNase H-like HicB family nuclease